MTLIFFSQLRLSKLPVDDPSFPVLGFVYALFVLAIIVFTFVTLRKIKILKMSKDAKEKENQIDKDEKKIPENPFLKEQAKD